MLSVLDQASPRHRRFRQSFPLSLLRHAECVLAPPRESWGRSYFKSQHLHVIPVTEDAERKFVLYPWFSSHVEELKTAIWL